MSLTAVRLGMSHLQTQMQHGGPWQRNLSIAFNLLGRPLLFSHALVPGWAHHRIGPQRTLSVAVRLCMPHLTAVLEIYCPTIQRW